jgi:hypothetical protein
MLMSILAVRVDQIIQFSNKKQENLKTEVEVQKEKMKQMIGKSLLKVLNKIQIYFRLNVLKKM